MNIMFGDSYLAVSITITVRLCAEFFTFYIHNLYVKLNFTFLL